LEQPDWMQGAYSGSPLDLVMAEIKGGRNGRRKSQPVADDDHLYLRFNQKHKGPGTASAQLPQHEHRFHTIVDRVAVNVANIFWIICDKLLDDITAWYFPGRLSLACKNQFGPISL
jgi:hypothetical protein